MYVQVLMIKFSGDIFPDEVKVFANYDLAFAAVADFARRNWRTHDLGEIPSDPEDIVDIYFSNTEDDCSIEEYEVNRS